MVHIGTNYTWSKKKIIWNETIGVSERCWRVFRVIKSRFAIVAIPSCFGSINVQHDIMTACTIMHNMIIENERDLSAPVEEQSEIPNPEVETIMIDENIHFQEFFGRYKKIKK